MIVLNFCDNTFCPEAVVTGERPTGAVSWVL